MPAQPAQIRLARDIRVIDFDVSPVAPLTPLLVSCPEYLFALEEHPSSIDGEEGVQPYVYEAHPGGLVARWRGSALAWPLLDAALLPGDGAVLCALHRRDSFLVLEPGATGVRTAAYRWNGFGFSGVNDATVLGRCRSTFGVEK